MLYSNIANQQTYSAHIYIMRAKAMHFSIQLKP